MPVFFVSVSLLVLTFVVMPVSLSAGFGADAVRRTGYVRVSLFFLPVFRADVRLDSAFGNLLVTHGKKTDEIHLNADKTDERSIVRLIRRPMLSCLRVRPAGARRARRVPRQRRRDHVYADRIESRVRRRLGVFPLAGGYHRFGAVRAGVHGRYARSRRVRHNKPVDCKYYIQSFRRVKTKE